MTRHYVRFDHPCPHDGVLTAIVLPDSAGIRPPDLMVWCRGLPGRHGYTSHPGPWAPPGGGGERTHYLRFERQDDAALCMV